MYLKVGGEYYNYSLPVRFRSQETLRTPSVAGRLAPSLPMPQLSPMLASTLSSTNLHRITVTVPAVSVLPNMGDSSEHEVSCLA